MGNQLSILNSLSGDFPSHSKTIVERKEQVKINGFFKDRVDKK